MSTITLKDLSENVDLDRKAMRDIVGGARRGGYSAAIQVTPSPEFRLVNYPAGICAIPQRSGKQRK